METKTKLEQDITDITLKIYKEFPELSKYITEIPIKVSVKDKEAANSKNLEDYYYSLVEIVKNYAETHKSADKTKLKFPEYPLYPPSEDIYNKAKEVEDIDPEHINRNKTPNEIEGGYNEKNFKNHMSGDDLDIPGSELDDQQESVGSEDEENNYYSLGGDNHNDLEEDNG